MNGSRTVNKRALCVVDIFFTVKISLIAQLIGVTFSKTNKSAGNERLLKMKATEIFNTFSCGLRRLAKTMKIPRRGV